MTLDPECVRDVMIYLEDHLVLCRDEDGIDNTRTYQFLEVSTHQLCEDTELVDRYGEDNIVYTVLQLWRNQMILLEEDLNPGEEFYHLHVIDITWQGHEFLGNVRSDTVWKQVSTVAKKAGVFSVKGLFQVAGAVISGISNNPQLIGQILSQIG